MIILLTKFEAIESRIASCPRGVPSRVHSLRLRKRPLTHRRPQSTVGQTVTQEDASVARLEAGKTGRRAEEHNGQYSWDEDKQRLKIRKTAPTYISSLKHNTALDRNHFADILKDISGTEPAGTIFQDAGKKVFKALKAGNPEAVLKELMRMTGKKERHSMRLSIFFKDLPPSTFSEILRSLDPNHFLSQYTELHKEFGTLMARRIGITDPGDLNDGYLEFSKLFLDQATSIIEARCQHWPPTLSDFKYLLKCARATGDLNAAERIWASMETMSDIIPDSDCYNLMLATKCLDSEVKNDIWRYRLRAVPKNSHLRMIEHPPYELQGHLLGHNPGGIKAITSQIFRKMVRSGVSGNGETFCFMMIAMAREADLAAVNSILKRVWEIDVENLMSDSPEMPAKELAPDSPFYPSAQLLFTIVHCFGINNQIPTALRVLDFVSRQYSIPIPSKTWSELFQWTFVVSHPYNRKFKRRGVTISDGSEIPSLPLDSISNLWHTMISEPYNVKPTLHMYNNLITNLLLRSRWGEVQYHIHAAYQLFKSDIKTLSRQLLILERSRSRITSADIIEKRLQQVYLGRLRVQRSRFYMHRWLKRLIKRAGHSMSNGHAWSTQNIPNLVREWSQFLPHKFEYKVAMGTVSINIKSEKVETLRRMRVNRNRFLGHEEGPAINSWMMERPVREQG